MSKHEVTMADLNQYMTITVLVCSLILVDGTVMFSYTFGHLCDLISVSYYNLSKLLAISHLFVSQSKKRKGMKHKRIYYRSEQQICGSTLIYFIVRKIGPIFSC